MKRLATLLLLGALAALILQPVSAAVNAPFGNPVPRADGGIPMPPFPPQSVVVADGGIPMPPFPPPGVTDAALLA